MSYVNEFVCGACGKDCGSRRSLGQHRRWCKGDKAAASTDGAQPMRRKRPPMKTRKRGKKAGADPKTSARSVAPLFEKLAQAINGRSALDGEIVAGMRQLVNAVKGLRKVTLKTRHDLLELKRDLTSLQDKSHEDDDV